MLSTTESQVVEMVMGRVSRGLMLPDSGEMVTLQSAALLPSTCVWYKHTLQALTYKCTCEYIRIGTCVYTYMCMYMYIRTYTTHGTACDYFMMYVHVYYVHVSIHTCSLQENPVGMREVLFISSTLSISTPMYTVSSCSLH